MFARSSVDSKKDTFTKPFKLTPGNISWSTLFWINCFKNEDLKIGSILVKTIIRLFKLLTNTAMAQNFVFLSETPILNGLFNKPIQFFVLFLSEHKIKCWIGQVIHMVLSFQLLSVGVHWFFVSVTVYLLVQ